MDKLLKYIVIGSLFIFFIMLISIINVLLFLIDYNPYTKIVYGLFILIIGLIGVIQIITNKIQYKYFNGRLLGFAMAAIAIWGIMSFTALKLDEANEGITKLYLNDSDAISERKKEILSSGFNHEDLSKLRYELVEAELNKQEEDGIIFYYDDNYSKDSIADIKFVINDYNTRFQKVLSLDESKNTEVLVLANLNIIGAEQFGIGFVNLYNNKMNFINKEAYSYIYEGESKETIDTRYNALIAHEYTHKVTIDILNEKNIEKENLPPWFYEGIATYFESLYDAELMPEKFELEIDIKDNEKFMSDSIGGTYYKAAGILWRNVIEVEGQAVILEIFHEIENGKNPFEAFEAVTGKSFEELEKGIFE